MSSNPLVDDVTALMVSHGISKAVLLKASYNEHSFGDAEALFQIGSFMLKFVRDRGQDFVDIIISSFPEHAYQFIDVDLAFGWKTLDEVLKLQEPEPIEQILSRIKENMGTLESALSPEHVVQTASLLSSRSAARSAAMNRMAADHT